MKEIPDNFQPFILSDILPFVPDKCFVYILSVKCFLAKDLFWAERRLKRKGLFFPPHWAFEKLDLDSWKVYMYLRLEKSNKTLIKQLEILKDSESAQTR